MAFFHINYLKNISFPLIICKSMACFSYLVKARNNAIKFIGQNSKNILSHSFVPQAWAEPLTWTNIRSKSLKRMEWLKE